jgi:hypothetical protein
MLRNPTDEAVRGATMFNSGRVVLKRGNVWNEIWIAATMYNL